MISNRYLLVSLLLAAVLSFSAEGFSVAPAAVATSASSSAARSVGGRASSSAAGPLFIFNKKKRQEEEDLSYIETRDMTRAEMEDLNKQNEEIMNAELWGMTLFSLVISVPMLYLVWVAFFSETANIIEDF